MKQQLLSGNYVALLNARVSGELQAEAMYRQMANTFQGMGMFGAQKFCLSQAAEEATHYQRLVDILNDYGIVAAYQFKAVEISPELGIGEMLMYAMAKEQELFKAYSLIAYEAMSNEEKEMGVHQAALEFVEIQRKAVGEFGDILARYELQGDIYAFDKYLDSLA